MMMRHRKIRQARCKMHWYFESGFWAWLGRWIKASDDRARARRNKGVAK
jgi:hypothetical protein